MTCWLTTRSATRSAARMCASSPASECPLLLAFWRVCVLFAVGIGAHHCNWNCWRYCKPCRSQIAPTGRLTASLLASSVECSVAGRTDATVCAAVRGAARHTAYTPRSNNGNTTIGMFSITELSISMCLARLLLLRLFPTLHSRTPIINTQSPSRLASLRRLSRYCWHNVNGHHANCLLCAHPTAPRSPPAPRRAST